MLAFYGNKWGCSSDSLRCHRKHSAPGVLQEVSRVGGHLGFYPYQPPKSLEKKGETQKTRKNLCKGKDKEIPKKQGRKDRVLPEVPNAVAPKAVGRRNIHANECKAAQMSAEARNPEGPNLEKNESRLNA